MKRRISFVFICSIASLIIIILGIMTGGLLFPEGNGIMRGAVLMLLAIPVHIFARKHKKLYLLSVILNMVGTGFAISSYYISNEINLKLTEVVFPAGCALLFIMLMYIALVIFKKVNKILVIIEISLNIILIAGFAVLWAVNGNTFYSLGFFMLVTALFFVVIMLMSANENKNLLKLVSYAGFGTFMIIAFIIAVIISEGEIIDGFISDLAEEGISGIIKKMKK